VGQDGEGFIGDLGVGSRDFSENQKIVDFYSEYGTKPKTRICALALQMEAIASFPQDFPQETET
jgi:hypothetical protein